MFYYTAGYAPVGFVQPPFFPFPQTTVTKLNPIHVQTTVRFPNGFTRVFYPNKGPSFPFFGGLPPIIPAPVFPVATNLIRPAPIKTVIPTAPKVKPEPAPVKPIIEKPETLKPVEEVGKPGTYSLLQICSVLIEFLFIYLFFDFWNARAKSDIQEMFESYCLVFIVNWNTWSEHTRIR